MKIVQETGIFSIIIILFMSFTQCKSQDIEKEAPFTVKEKTYFYWVGGVKGKRGTNIKIVGNFNTDDLEFKTIYFKNKEYNITFELLEDQFTIIGKHKTIKKDLILHQDPTKEFGNKVPTAKKIPFELQNNEAVIVYTVKGKEQYFKITGVKQLKTVYYP